MWKCPIECQVFWRKKFQKKIPKTSPFHVFEKASDAYLLSLVGLWRVLTKNLFWSRWCHWCVQNLVWFVNELKKIPYKKKHHYSFYREKDPKKWLTKLAGLKLKKGFHFCLVICCKGQGKKFEKNTWNQSLSTASSKDKEWIGLQMHISQLQDFLPIRFYMKYVFEKGNLQKLFKM